MRRWVTYSKRLISRLDQASTMRPCSRASSQRISSRGVARLPPPGTLDLPARVKNPPWRRASGSRPLRATPPVMTRSSKAANSFFGVSRKKSAPVFSSTG